MSDTLPTNWEQWQLADVGEWFGGGTPSSSNAQFWDGDIPWVSPKDMKVASITSTQDRITVAAVQNSAVKLISAESVLFVTRSGILAHSFPVATTKVQVTVNQDLKAITPVEVVDHNYLAWLLRALERQILTTCSKHGTTVHSIEIPTLKDLRVPIPPPAEQRRIVAKIEVLFSELDKGVESLITVREQLKAYRQAVLKHAFSGKLTAQWRHGNNDKVESARLLIARIKKERELHYQAKISIWNTAPNKNGGRPRPPKTLVPLGSQERDELPALPDSWIWEKLGWMTCGVEYGTAAKSSKSGSVPVLRMGNIQNAKFDWSDLVYSSDEDEILKYALKAGDVLFNRTNSPELVGKTAIYRGERPALFAGYLIRVNQIASFVDSQYLNLFLNSHIARQQGNRVKTDGVNQSNINGERLSNYPFPYCSLAEQREIVKLLEEKLSIIDQLEDDVEQETKKSEALRQSMLRKAFSGQLVAQDPSDEPASVLLDRFRAQSEDGGGGRKKHNKNGKKEAA